MYGIWDDLTAGISRQKGQGLVEYALLLAFLVTLGAILLMVRPELRESITNTFTSMAEILDSF